MNEKLSFSEIKEDVKNVITRNESGMTNESDCRGAVTFSGLYRNHSDLRSGIYGR